MNSKAMPLTPSFPVPVAQHPAYPRPYLPILKAGYLVFVRFDCHVLEYGRKLFPRGMSLIDRVDEVEGDEYEKHKKPKEQDSQRCYYGEDCEAIRCSIERCTTLEFSRGETDLHGVQNNCDVDNGCQDPSKIMCYKA